MPGMTLLYSSKPSHMLSLGCGQRPESPLKLHGIRDDVRCRSSADHAEGQYTALVDRKLPGNNALHLRQQVAGGHHRIDTAVGMGPVASLSAHHDLYGIGGRVGSAETYPDLSRRRIRPGMYAKHVIRPGLQHSLPDQSPGAAPDLLRRLEHEPHSP